MKKRCFLPISVAVLLPASIFSLPQIKEIAAGHAEIERSESSLVVSTSERAIINYESFNIAGKERVQFNQPTASSSVLNRVVGQDPSSILGSIQSNGKVFLVNPHGVYFGPTASVNVGSLVVSALDIADSDFLNDHFEFTLQKGSERALIHNLGHLAVSPEGSILLIAPHIRNEGILTARAGRVAYLSGEKVSVDFVGDGLVGFAVRGELESALIEHLGSIQAPEGNVHLRMKTADKIIQQVLNTDGILEGVQIVQENGIIRLAPRSEIVARHIETDAPGVSVEGHLDASDHYKGGTIHLLGDSVALRGATVDASGDKGGGTVLVGGDYKGQGVVRNSLHADIDEMSVVKADARLQGDGGKIILWADELMGFTGNLQAKGGVEGGDGGFVETSCGGDSPRFRGQVTTLAPQGQPGQWLIDPTSVNILTGGGGTLASVMPPNCTVGGGITIDPATSGLNASTSNVTICAQSAPGSITITSAISMTTNNVSLSFQAAGTITINNNITTRSGALNFLGSAVTVGNSVTLNTAGAGTGANISFGTSNNTVSINDSIANAHSLTLNAGTGAVFVSGAIGNNSSFGAVTITGNGGITLNNVGAITPTTGASTLTLNNTGIGGITLNGGTYRTSGAQTYNGDVLIGTSTTMVSGASSNVTINGPIDPTTHNVSSLSINSTNGNISITGGMGTHNGFSSLTLNAGNGTLGLLDVGGSTVGSTGGLALTASTITLNGSLYSTSGAAQSFNSPVVLGATPTFISTNQAIAFTSTVNATVAGSQGMTLNAGTGAVTFSNTVGATNALGDVEIINSGNINLNGSSIFTKNGAIDFLAGGPVILGTNVALSSTNTGTGAAIEMGGTIDGAQTLTINAGVGAVNIASIIGGSSALSTLQITGNGGITLAGIGGAGAVTLNGAAGILLKGSTYNATSHTYNGNVTLGAGAISLTTTAGAATINGTIEGSADNTNALTITTIGGDILLNGDVGSNYGLANLGLDAGTSGITIESVGGNGVGSYLGMSLTGVAINLNGSLYFTTGGAQTYTGDVLLSQLTNMISTNQDISFNAALNGAMGVAPDLILQAGSGAVSFAGTVGSSQPLGAVTISSAGAVTAHAFNAATLRETSATGINQFLGALSTTDAAGIMVNGSTVSFSSTINTTNGGPLSVTHTGPLTFSAAAMLGGDFKESGGGSVSLGGDITASAGDIIFADALTLAAPVSLSAGSSIFLSNTVGGAFNFTTTASDGSIHYLDSITTSSLTATGLTIIQASTVQTTGNVNYTGALRLGGDITVTGSGTIEMTGPVMRTTTNNVTLQTNGQNVAISGTIDGDALPATRNLTISTGAGSAIFSSVIGGDVPLNNLTVSGNFISIEGIGGLSNGVSGTLSLTSATDIDFSGTNYIAGTQSYTVPGANSFNMLAGSGIVFSASAGDITFSGGEIYLSAGTDMFVATNNQHFTFASLIGASHQSLFIDLGSGDAHLGSIGANNTHQIFDVNVNAGSIDYNGPIYASKFSHYSQNGIANAAAFTPLSHSELTYQIFNAANGSVGTALDSIAVEAPNAIVIAGASSGAYFIGTTQDGTIHCLPSNPPVVLTFNGLPQSCNTSPNSIPSLPILTSSSTSFPRFSNRAFFVPGIYDPNYNLSDYFYFQPDFFSKAYMTPRDLPVFVKKAESGIEK